MWFNPGDKMVFYFKMLVITKVRPLIDSLPFTREGYTRAKYIPMTKYEKPREAADVYPPNNNKNP